MVTERSDGRYGVERLDPSTTITPATLDVAFVCAMGWGQVARPND